MTIDTYSEEHRFRCEVRYLIQMRINRGERAVRAFFEDASKKRSAANLTRLNGQYLEQLAAGNKGRRNEWIEPKETAK